MGRQLQGQFDLGDPALALRGQRVQIIVAGWGTNLPEGEICHEDRASASSSKILVAVVVAV